MRGPKGLFSKKETIHFIVRWPRGRRGRAFSSLKAYARLLRHILCVYLAASRSLPSVRLFRAAPSVLSTLSRIRRSAASAKTSLTPAAVPLKWCQNFAMRRCFEMHILPKRCKRETASWPGPHAGGDVISLVLREMQGPARDAWTLV